MSVTRISGNQISTATEAIITTLSFLNTTSKLVLPRGSSDDRPTGVVSGTIRFNTDLDSAEIYVSDTGQGTAGWTDVGGGGPSVGNNSVIRTNPAYIDTSCSIGPANGDEFQNGFTKGPVTINNGVTVTVETNGVWEIF